MSEKNSIMMEKLKTGKRVVIAEWQQPADTSAAAMQSLCRQFRGKADVLSVSDNRDAITISALAGASIALAEGLEPILHITTRDRNRIALASEVLGARALGISNLLVTSGTHQTLGSCSGAKSVYDIDTVQLLDMIRQPDMAGCFPGAVADPFADPPVMQLLQTGKKIRAGAQFLITKPVFDMKAFGQWWEAMLGEGLPDQAAVIAGIYILPDAETARALSAKRPDPRIPAALLERLAGGQSREEQRTIGIQIAMETMGGLLKNPKIRGIAVHSDGDHEAVLEVIEAARKAGV